jgi:putative transposase
MHRGARKAPIFLLERDCWKFLELLKEMVERFALEVHSYSLMPNHYHLLIRSKLGNLSRGMQFLNGNYTLWLNNVHRWDGPVFRGRFKSQLVEDEEHLRILIAYIHLNPLEARLVKRLSDECWTSHLAYMSRESKPDWLRTDFFLDLFGGRKKLSGFIRSYRIGRREYPEDFNPVTGLFGKKAIKREPERKGKRKLRSDTAFDSPRNRPPEEVLDEVTRITGVGIADLRHKVMGPRANPARRFAIWALCRGTGLTQRQIGKLLNVSHLQVGKLLGRMRKKGLKGLKEPVKGWVNSWVEREG